MKASEPTQWRGLSAGLVFILIALWWLTYLTFYPGLVTHDSIAQYREAATGQYTNISPPLMAAIWAVLNKVENGTVPIFILQITLYWLSFGTLALYFMFTGRRAAVLLPFAGLFPILFAFSGVIWKDVLLATAWGLGSTLFLFATKVDRTSAFTAATLRLTSATLLLFGAAIRHNAAPAGIFLAVALCVSTPNLSMLKKTMIAAFLVVAVIFAGPLSGQALGAADRFPFRQVFSWDIQGISFFSSVDYRIVPPHRPLEEATISCYSPRLCDACREVAFRNKTEAFSRWFNAIVAEPGAYLKHRALVFSMLLRFGCTRCDPYMWVDGTQSNPYGFQFKENSLHRSLARSISLLAKTPLSRPYLWLVLSASLALLNWKERRRPACLALSAIAGSGFVYGVTYFFIAITDEFRYFYWVMFSVTLVSAAVAVDATFHGIRRIVIFVLLPASFVWLTEHVSRSTLHTEMIAPSMTTNY